MRVCHGSLCLSLLAGALFGVGWSEGQEAADPTPRVVVPEPTHDFGTVTQGETVMTEFRLENRGGAPLELRKAHWLSIFQVSPFPATLPPGEHVVIEATLDTTSLAGPNELTLTFTTNDPDNQSLRLNVEVEVRPYLIVYPGQARYIVVQGFKPKGLIAQTLWPTDGGDLEVLGVDSPNPSLEVRFREATEQERHESGIGRQWRIETVLAPDAAVGPLLGEVVIHTRHAKQKRVSFPISGFVRPIFAVTPTVADFGTVTMTEEPLKRSLHVKNFAEETHALTRVDDDLDGLVAEITPIKEGREYYVVLELDPSMPKGPFRGRVKIHTSSAGSPVLEVEVKGTIL